MVDSVRIRLTLWYAGVLGLSLIAFALLGTKEQDMEKLLGFGAFFNLFVFLGSICAIVGFMKLPRPRQ